MCGGAKSCPCCYLHYPQYRYYHAVWHTYDTDLRAWVATMAHVKGMSTNNVDPYAEFKGTKNKGNFDYGNRDRHVPPLAYKFIKWFGKLPGLPSGPPQHIADFLTTDLGLEWMENLGVALLHDGLRHTFF